SEILTYEEVDRLVGVFMGLGVHTIRLTGGEPLARRELHVLVEMLAARGVPDLSLTTNGVLLAEHAGALARAGLKRVNVSVDSLEPVQHGPEPATMWRFRYGAHGAIGVIASVTEQLCSSCNRIRVTSDGQFRTCLFALEETHLRTLLREGTTD